MLHRLSLRLSWICLLLFSSGACFPATKEDYQYPYTALGRSGGGPVSRPALVSLQSGAAASRAGSPTGNQSPPSLGAPSGAALSYEPRRFVSPASRSEKPPRVPEVPPSFSVQLQPGVGSSGNSRPFYSPSSHAAAPATPSFAAPSSYSNAPAASGVGYGSSRYAAAPAASGVGYGSSRYAAAPAASGVGYGSSRYAAAPAASGVGYGSSRYAAAPASTGSVGAGGSAGAPSTFRFEGSAAAAGGPSSSASLPWPEQSVAGFQASFYHPSRWMPSRSFPDLSVWDSELAAPQSMSETSPEALSSYIVQSSNGYLRAREVLSHNRYVPEYPEPPVYQAAKAAPKTAPKGGKI